jgi:hypothetical protein
VTDQRDWVSIEEIVPACVVEQDAEDVTNLGRARFGQRKVSKPRFYFYRFGVREFVVSPVWHDPIFQVTFVPSFGRVAFPSLVSRRLALSIVLNQFTDRQRSRPYPHDSKVDRSYQPGNSLPGGRCGPELPHCADRDPSIDSPAVMRAISIPNSQISGPRRRPLRTKLPSRIDPPSTGSAG